MNWKLFGESVLAAAIGGAVPAVADALSNGKSLSETKTIALAGAFMGVSLYLKTPRKQEEKPQETQERKS